MTKEFWSDSMAGTRDFPLLQNVQINSGGPLQFVSRALLWGQSSHSMKMTTHLHLFPRLGMSRPVSLLPTNAFTACTGATLPLPLPQVTLEQHKTEKNLYWRKFSTTTIDLASVTCNHNIY